MITPIFGYVTLVLLSGEMVDWKKLEPFDTVAECKVFMADERVRLAEIYDAILSVATCDLDGTAV